MTQRRWLRKQSRSCVTSKPDATCRYLTPLAGLEVKGDFDLADRLYSEATDVIDALLVNVSRRQLKSSLIATLSDAYIGHFELTATKFADPAKGYEIIERARGRNSD